MKSFSDSVPSVIGGAGGIGIGLAAFAREGAHVAHSDLNEAAFEAQCQRMRPRIYRLAFHHLSNAQDAEDITQEALLRAWTHYAAYDPARSFDAWIARIVTNLCIDHLRRRKNRKALSLDAFTPAQWEQQVEIRVRVDRSNDPAVRLLEQEGGERLKRSIAALPAHHRQCMQLLERGHSYEEIAMAMRCPLGTVRSRVHRARARVRAAMRADGKPGIC